MYKNITMCVCLHTWTAVVVKLKKTYVIFLIIFKYQRQNSSNDNKIDFLIKGDNVSELFVQYKSPT